MNGTCIVTVYLVIDDGLKAWGFQAQINEQQHPCELDDDETEGDDKQNLI